MALLKNYGFVSISQDEFEVNFEIPNNCNYTTSYDSGKNINTILVQLNAGQSQPSSTFVKKFEILNSTNSVLNVDFEQKQGTTSIKKPKIYITE